MSIRQIEGSGVSDTPMVLIVDDDPMQRRLARAAVERAGMHAEEAQDGESALAIFACGEPDMVLLDVLMPGVDGYEVCARLRCLARNTAMPILMMTGLNDDESIEKAYASGATDFITKPIQWPILAHRLRYMLRTAQISAALTRAQARFEETHNQLLQTEKMASIGQLAAGVAHEINNPIGYVNSNLGSLESYLKQLFELVEAYARSECAITDTEIVAGLQAAKRSADLEFLREDVFALLAESREGISRVRQIVQDLKDFSRVGGADEWTWADLHAGLDSTLNIVNNEIKYKAQLVREYGDLPEIECLPSQLNQVFLNVLVNAAQAIEEQGTITVRSGTAGNDVWVEIEDTGKGIAPEHLNRIFDPFFTTKAVGKGTGLGLALSYGIVQKHQGRIETRSELGRGTTFRIVLPVCHSARPAEPERAAA